MNILITCYYLDLSGSSTYTYTLAKTLKQSGHSVAVFCLAYGVVADKLIQESIRVYTEVDDIPKEFFDIILGQHNITYTLVRPQLPATPIIAIIHGILPFLESPISEKQNICGYVAVSEEVKNYLISKYNIDNEIIKLARNPIDTDFFRARKPIKKNLKNILFISNRSNTEIINTIKKASQIIGANITIIGGENPKNNVQKYINKSDLVISLGRGVLEAMSCQRACLVYDYNGGDGIITEDNYQEIQKNNFSGRRYGIQYDPKQLAVELKKYHPKMGEINRKIIKHEYDARKIADSIIKFAQKKTTKNLQPQNIKTDRMLYYLGKDLGKKSKELHDIDNKYNLDRAIQFAKRNIIKPRYKILGLMMIRNEALILEDSLNHFSQIVDKIIVFDDASTDNSRHIAKNHPAVIKVIGRNTWIPNRFAQQTKDRQKLLEESRKYNPTWLFYSDCDERFEGRIREYLNSAEAQQIDGVKIKLFDGYITEYDQEPYKKGKLLNYRKYFGPERRDILMIWKNKKNIKFLGNAQREPQIDGKIVTKFFCQHYGKSLSVNHWEETCDYYANFPEPFRSKWIGRKGKAIHSRSDFENKLYTWEEVKKNSIKIY